MHLDGEDEWLTIEEFAEASGYKEAGVRSMMHRGQVQVSGEWGRPMISWCSYVRFIEAGFELKREKRQKRLEIYKEHRQKQYEVEKEKRRLEREERKRLGIKIPRPNRKKKKKSKKKVARKKV